MPTEPRQQRCVLDRVPGPEPAPAEDLVGPPGAEHDADGQARPGEERPAAGLALPGVVQPPGDQGGHRWARKGGETDQPQVEHRGVEEDQRIVLEEHVGPESVRGDPSGHMGEGVCRAEHEPEEEGGHHVDGQGGPGHQVVLGPLAEPPDHRGGVPPEDERPEQDRSRQCRPHPGDRVEQRGRPAVVVGDIGEGEVVGDEGALHGDRRDHSPEEDQRREPASQAGARPRRPRGAERGRRGPTVPARLTAAAKGRSRTLVCVEGGGRSSACWTLLLAPPPLATATAGQRRLRATAAGPSPLGPVGNGHPSSPVLLRDIGGGVRWCA